MIDKHLSHIIAAQTEWIGGVVPKLLEPSGLAVEGGERSNRANPEYALAILIDAIHHGAAHAIGVSGLVLKFLKEWRSSRKASGRHHVQTRPDVSFAILKQGSHIVLTETLRVGGIMTVADKYPAFAVKLEETGAQGRKPQSSIAIFEHRHDPVGERVREVTFMERVMSERIRLSIEDLQPASGGMDDPEHSGAILME